MKLYEPIEVDLYKPYPLKKVDAQQGNIGRGIIVTLTAAGRVVYPDGETVVLWAKKPDKTVSYIPCLVVDGKIQAGFTNQMLALPGTVHVELEMTSGEERLSTPIFLIEVHRSNINDSAVESQNEFTVLQKAIENVNAALQEVDELKKTGLKGDPGEPGTPGADGKAATIAVGNVSASEPGADPEVVNAGTENAAILNFVLPRGPAGPAGADGKERVFFGAYAEFPVEGNDEILYVDTSNTEVLLLYRWNGMGYIPSGGGAADLNVIASEYDPEKTYEADTYVMYLGDMYCFNSTKEPGEWDSTVVKKTTVAAELSDLNANLPSMKLMDVTKELKREATTTEATYTATEDCWAVVSLRGYNKLGAYAYIDGILVSSVYNSDTSANVQVAMPIYLAKGSILRIVGNVSYNASYIIYGTKS